MKKRPFKLKRSPKPKKTMEQKAHVGNLVTAGPFYRAGEAALEKSIKTGAPLFRNAPKHIYIRPGDKHALKAARDILTAEPGKLELTAPFNEKQLRIALKEEHAWHMKDRSIAKSVIARERETIRDLKGRNKAMCKLNDTQAKEIRRLRGETPAIEKRLQQVTTLIAKIKQQDEFLRTKTRVISQQKTEIAGLNGRIISLNADIAGYEELLSSWIRVRSYAVQLHEAMHTLVHLESSLYTSLDLASVNPTTATTPTQPTARTEPWSNQALDRIAKDIKSDMDKDQKKAQKHAQGFTRKHKSRHDIREQNDRKTQRIINNTRIRVQDLDDDLL